MEKSFRLTEPCAIQLAEGGIAPKKIQVLRTGKFKHPIYGKFEINQKTLSDFVANFKNNVRKVDLAVDYKHESQDIAAGWMRDIALSEDGKALWADVEWTKKGRQVLEEKEFRYVSADFQFNYEDPETETKFGPTLLGAGLTNRPFVKGMSPAVELNENNEGDDMTLEQVQKENEELKAKIVGLEADAKKLSESTLKSEIESLRKENETLKADKKATEEKAAEAAKLAEQTKAFDVLLSEGKAVEAQRDAFIKGDMAEFVKLSEPTHRKAIGSGQGKHEQSKKDACDEVMELAEKVMKEKGIQDTGKAISYVLAEPKNADLAKRYRAEVEAK